ncbi:MAG: cobyrinate a,c-diamide synthase [Oscillospiraceae bacterium]|jgi:cobyrinic acid a,c-diamide synthase|nr:cobyrinate a,c-diamide synthase [Oscillospiraceae bacterium]
MGDSPGIQYTGEICFSGADKLDRILIAGTHSGCGKTTVTCALLSALKARGLNVTAFKCGPDYIDPMFHREAIGVSSRNLDPYFCGSDTLRELFAAHAGEISVIEGVMGYYDGIGSDGHCGTYDVAAALKSNVVLVVNVSGMLTSAGAVIKGFKEYKSDSRICGIIFNGASAAMYELLKPVAENAGVTPLGFLPKSRELEIGSRHLGLITASEISDIKDKLNKLGKLAEQYIDINGILTLSRSEDFALTSEKSERSNAKKTVIAVADDAAFCFKYAENLELLTELGCKIKYFSPLNDEQLPDNIDGMYLCGGYPELYLNALSANKSMLQSVLSAIRNGLPTIAECGGFMYLHDTIDGAPMVGAIHAEAFKTERLKRFGYSEITAKSDNLLCKSGERIRVHEFHYYDSDDYGSGFTALKASGGDSLDCVHSGETLFAGFPHLYFHANRTFAETFVRKASEYRANREAT